LTAHLPAHISVAETLSAIPSSSGKTKIFSNADKLTVRSPAHISVAETLSAIPVSSGKTASLFLLRAPRFQWLTTATGESSHLSSAVKSAADLQVGMFVAGRMASWQANDSTALTLYFG